MLVPLEDARHDLAPARRCVSRSFCADDALNLTPVRKMTLEYALEYIGEDNLVDVTPESIRLGKKVLEPRMRK